MTNTNKTGRKMTMKQRQAMCTHTRCIEMTGYKVCTACEKVIETE